ncbi:glutaredoxin family protein [Peribacillus alkalitolerans]|uniref:glutaredoxin family protein n=1 Tax=Peribacillus alkalitolerans TaxID=1550385 RepID=UPI0013D73FBB|nr:glutaredoxin family protein [Peribacillus alkalitolerans]
MAEVILFSQPQCPPCEFAKNYFKENSIPFVEKNISQNAAARKELTTKYQSFSTPTIIIGSEVVRGFDQARIEELLSL